MLADPDAFELPDARPGLRRALVGRRRGRREPDPGTLGARLAGIRQGRGTRPTSPRWPPARWPGAGRPGRAAAEVGCSPLLRDAGCCAVTQPGRRDTGAGRRRGSGPRRRFPTWPARCSRAVGRAGHRHGRSTSRWRLHADPELTARLDRSSSAACWCIVSHLLRDARRRAATIGVIDADTRAWDRGADAEINDDLWRRAVRPAGRSCPPDLARRPALAEDYFSGPPAADGAAADLGLRHRRRRPPRPGTRTARPVAWQARCSAGSRPGLVRHARGRARCRPACSAGPSRCCSPRDWRRVLAAELRRAVADTAGSRLLLPPAVAARLGVRPGGAARAVPAGARGRGGLRHLRRWPRTCGRGAGRGRRDLRRPGRARGLRVLACDTAVHRAPGHPARRWSWPAAVAPTWARGSPRPRRCDPGRR